MKSKSLALDACDALVQAYRNGEASQHIDWEDVDIAYNLAVKALEAEEIARGRKKK
jgi:hypothetical protein